VFLTGCAGSGKTYLVRQLLASKIVACQRVAATATTAQAAQHLGAKGQTLHAFVGLPPQAEDMPTESLLNNIGIDRLRKLQLLLIDEVSMLSARLLDTLDELLRRVRDDEQPFGGIQLLLIGDLLQLPPVLAPFPFEARCWARLGLWPVYLHGARRQRDIAFIEVLARIRRGQLNVADEAFLLKLSRPLDVRAAAAAAKVYSTNEECSSENQRYDVILLLLQALFRIWLTNPSLILRICSKLDQLDGAPACFDAVDSANSGGLVIAFLLWKWLILFFFLHQML
jgi:ATP-dependent DNA helicase PIF1